MIWNSRGSWNRYIKRKSPYLSLITKPYTRITLLLLLPNLLVKIISPPTYFFRSGNHLSILPFEVSPFLRYLFHIKFVHIDFWVLYILHNVENTILDTSNRHLNPKPPFSLGLEISFHVTQCLFLLSSLKFHRILAKIMSRWWITYLGWIIADKRYVRILLKTLLISTSFPQMNEACLFKIVIYSEPFSTNFQSKFSFSYMTNWTTQIHQRKISFLEACDILHLPE